MRLLWEDRAWADYLYWQTQDKKTLKRIKLMLAVAKERLNNPSDVDAKPLPPSRSSAAHLVWKSQFDFVRL